MSNTQDCYFCDDILDADELPDLHVGTKYVCIDCWYKIQDYLTARGMTILLPERRAVPPEPGSAPK